MKHLIYFLLSLIFPFFLNGQGPSKSTSQYHITIHNHDQALIECTLTATDSILRMSGTGAEQFENRWAKFVSDLSVTSENGEEVQVKSLPGGKWSHDADPGQILKLNYTVTLDHEEHNWSGGIDGVAYKRDHGVFYTGRSLFIVNDPGNESIIVNFQVPDGWKVSTVWDPLEADQPSFVVRNNTELLESMVFAGKHDQLVFKREGFELLFALGGDEIISKRQEYESLASGVLDYYIKLMGGVPNPSPENPFHRALVIINPSNEADGEVIGNSISLLESTQKDPMAQIIAKFGYAHEFFHLWNGKSFFPSDQRCEWFKEGVTNYYTLKALYHVGVLNEQSFLGMLDGFFYKRYASDSGTGSLSLTQGDSKHDHWGLIYCGGLFAGISLDIIIRQATENEQSLDDLMKGLFLDHGGTDLSYTLENLRIRLSQLSGQDQTEFFETYIIGSEEIPLDKYLKLSGLNSEIQEGGLKISRQESVSQGEQEMIEGMLGAN